MALRHKAGPDLHLGRLETASAYGCVRQVCNKIIKFMPLQVLREYLNKKEIHLHFPLWRQYVVEGLT